MYQVNDAAYAALLVDVRSAAARLASFGDHGRICPARWSWGVRFTVRSHGEADPFRVAVRLAADLRADGWAAHSSGVDVVVNADASARALELAA